MKTAKFQYNGGARHDLYEISGQCVQVMRPSRDDEIARVGVGVGDMYRCRTDDGRTFDAFADELARN